MADDGQNEVIYRLADLIDEIRDQYAVIFIDTGPKESMLTTAAFAAATHVIVPLEMQGYSALGFEDNLELVQEVKDNWNPEIQLIGILPMRNSLPMLTPTEIVHRSLLSASQSAVMIGLGAWPLSVL